MEWRSWGASELISDYSPRHQIMITMPCCPYHWTQTKHIYIPFPVRLHTAAASNTWNINKFNLHFFVTNYAALWFTIHAGLEYTFPCHWIRRFCQQDIKMWWLYCKTTDSTKVYESADVQYRHSPFCLSALTAQSTRKQRSLKYMLDDQTT